VGVAWLTTEKLYSGRKGHEEKVQTTAVNVKRPYGLYDLQRESEANEGIPNGRTIDIFEGEGIGNRMTKVQLKGSPLLHQSREGEILRQN